MKQFPTSSEQSGNEQGLERKGDIADAAQRAALWSNRLQSLEDIEAQRAWQQSGSVAERRARSMFDGVRSPAPVGLPRTDALIAELARAVHSAQQGSAGAWRDVIEKLRHHPTPSGEVDVLRLLKSPATNAGSRLEWFQKEIAGLLRYTMENDYAILRDAQQFLEEQGPSMDDGSLELPPPSQEEMRTSMDELQEDKEGERKGYFSVHPFWGGYYREDVYERHAGGSRWAKDARQSAEIPSEEVVGPLNERRIFRGVVRAGCITALPIPYGFVPDHNTLKATDTVKLLRDQHGLWSIDARACPSTVAFTMDIGIPLRARSARAVAPEHLAVQDPYVSALTKPVLDALTGTDVQKARALKRFLRSLLQYSNDHTLNDVYEQHPQGYFAAIEQYKKADCDVANAENNNLCSAAQLPSRMVMGHYVKMKDAHGAALMNSGSRHGWAEAWVRERPEWFVSDATPEKDPTMDDNPPDEQYADEPGPGDYGEQDAPQLTPEELDQWKKDLLEAAKRAKQKTPEQLRDEEFAKEARCSVEEAARIRAKLEAARALRDRKGRVIRDHLSEEFQRIVESNLREVPTWKGPVKKSEGDAMDDVVMVGKDVRLGHADPLGYGQDEVQLQRTQEYGGMDVYAVADRSQSMNEIDPTTQQPKKDEQQLALFLLLDSVHGFSYKTERAVLEDQLIAPLSVRSGMVAFQAGSAETILPLSSTWKPKEQLDVWKGLESNIGGGTPANLGLAKVRVEIQQDIVKEQLRKQRGEAVKPRLREVLVFMDGDVDTDKQEDFFAQIAALEALGAAVSIWGMTESARKVEGYPNGHCVASAREMIEPITEHIIQKALALRAQEKTS